MGEQQLQYGYFGHITKFEKTEDGTLMVYGKAAGADLDLDGQRCDPVWLKSAMPSWHEWGNVREQHANIAAGVGVELTEGDEPGDWFLKAEIVDAGTIRKVEKRVLKGFSVGIVNGRVIKSRLAPNGVIDDGTIAEISLVDRPCNPQATLAIAKSFGGATLRPVDAPEVGDVDADGAEVIDVPELVTTVAPLDIPGLPVGIPPNAPGEPLIIDDPLPPERTPEQRAELVEKTLTWYRDALRTVADAHAGQWSHTVPFITKAAKPASEDEHADIAAAQAAIDQILDLIIAEAGQAKGGRVKELRDIEVLLSAARSLCCFMENEQGEDGEDMDREYGHEMAYGGYKAAGAWDEPDDDAGHGDAPVTTDVDKAAGGSATVVDATTDMITKAVAAAQAESKAAHEAELIALRADLEKALAAPKPGGPVTFKRVNQTSSAPAVTLTEAHPEYWRNLAKSPLVAPEIARAYVAKATEMEKGAST